MLFRNIDRKINIFWWILQRYNHEIWTRNSLNKHCIFQKVDLCNENVFDPAWQLLLFKKNSITAWLIFCFQLNIFLAWWDKWKGPNPWRGGRVENTNVREDTLLPGPCSTQECCAHACLCCLHLRPWAERCPFPGQKQSTKHPLHPPLNGHCWMPADPVLRGSMTQFTHYIQQSQLNHFKLTS